MPDIARYRETRTLSAGVFDAPYSRNWNSGHYRLARMDDQVMQALVDAAGHAIGHLASGAKDRRRFAQRVERPVRRLIRVIAASCCATK